MGAFLGSFAIYLIPLVGPHAAWLLGEHLYAELTRGIGRAPSWIAADVAAALAAQAALLVLLRWALSGRSMLRWLALAASVPFFFIALEWTYLLAIPSYFLIEPDAAPEQARWTEETLRAGEALPDPNRGGRIRSKDELWTAWKEYVPGATETPLPERIVVRAIDGAHEEIVPLAPPGPRSIELLDIDVAARTITLFEHAYRSRANALVTLGFDGAERGRTELPAGVEPQSTTVIRIGAGWVAWDAYREEGRYRVAWSLAGAAGSADVPLGRGITAVAADPTGSYVAISTTTSLNIGHIRDSVYVLSTKDAAEVFRRYLPTFTRSRVAFLGDERFAYDDRDGVHVLRISAR